MKPLKQFDLRLMLKNAACKILLLNLCFCMLFSTGIVRAQSIIDFNAALTGKAVLFNWSLSPDSGYQLLEVERSANQQNFNVCLSIKNVNTRVFAWDKNPEYGKSYYRLKVTSLSGTVSYSQTAMISYYPGTSVVNGHAEEMDKAMHNRMENLSGDESITVQALAKATYWVYDINAGNTMTRFERAENLNGLKAMLSSGRPYLIITLMNDAPAKKEYYFRNY